MQQFYRAVPANGIGRSYQNGAGGKRRTSRPCFQNQFRGKILSVPGFNSLPGCQSRGRWPLVRAFNPSLDSGAENLYEHFFLPPA